MSAHQGTFEENFIHYLETAGVHVDRPMVPTSLKINDDPKVLGDHSSHPVSVNISNIIHLYI
jgi:phenol 2-monooxygenase